MIIAIQKDDYGAGDSASSTWAELLVKAGHEVRWVNVYRADILEQMRGCAGFMWRWAHFDGMYRVARRLLPVLEKGLGMRVYPDQATCWHYDDKAAQALLFEALGIAAPRTWVWYSRKQAEAWVETATYPLVAKLTGGAGSTNVRLIKDAVAARAWIATMWERGLYRLADLTEGEKGESKKRLEEYHQAYALFQEYLPDNAFDTRVTVIGRRAFGFRRFNRDDDFRASGSGKIDWDPAAIDAKMIRLAFETARKLGTQSLAMDGMYRRGEAVVGEVSYTFACWAVAKCSGHWELNGETEAEGWHWVEGPMSAEAAQVEDFLRRLEAGRK